MSLYLNAQQKHFYYIRHKSALCLFFHRSNTFNRHILAVMDS
jgi:hypothetical protein